MVVVGYLRLLNHRIKTTGLFFFCFGQCLPSSLHAFKLYECEVASILGRVGGSGGWGEEGESYGMSRGSHVSSLSYGPVLQLQTGELAVRDNPF